MKHAGVGRGWRGPDVPTGGRHGGRIIWIGLAAVVVLDLAGGCGKIGSPIPPEDIGIAAKLERERQERAAGDSKESEPHPDDEVELPPLRPVRTR